MDEPVPVAEPNVHPAYAGFMIRAAAELIDQLLVVVLFFAAMFSVIVPTVIIAELAGREVGGDKYWNVMTPLLIFMVVMIYRAGFEGSHRQATPGKLALGMKVTDEDGNRLSFQRAAIRALMYVFVSVFFSLGFLMVWLTPRKQGLHDVVARTLVVRTR